MTRQTMRCSRIAFKGYRRLADTATRVILARGDAEVHSGTADAALSRGEDPSASPGRADLHIEIAKVARNDMLSEMLSAAEATSGLVFPPFNPGNRERSWREHRKLVDAIIHHDIGRARSVAITHIESARDHYLSAFSEG